jgi:hypothetical protein
MERGFLNPGMVIILAVQILVSEHGFDGRKMGVRCTVEENLSEK